MFSWYVAHVFSKWLWNGPSRPVITGITFFLTFHMRCISIVRSLYFNFSASFLITFLSPEIAASINIHAPFSLSRIIMSGLLLGIVLSLCICWFHSMVTLPPWLVYIIIIIIIIITRYGCLLSQAYSSWYFSWTSGDPHCSGFKLHTAVLSVLCVMFQV